LIAGIRTRRNRLRRASLFFAPAVILSEAKDPEEIDAATDPSPFTPWMQATHASLHPQSPASVEENNSCHPKDPRANPR
jgi:hypothetical protein